MRVLNAAYNHPLPAEEKAVVPLAGGIIQHGYQCGMIWGAALAAGAQAYRLWGPGPQAETMAVMATQKLTTAFRTTNRHINCLELTHIDHTSSTLEMIKYFVFKGGTISCLIMAKKFAATALGEINSALNQEYLVPSSLPVSCAALVARKMGLSDFNSTMAAGLAGGIGLSGGGCGALGTAIWGQGLKSCKGGKDKVEYKSPKASETINNFLKYTGYEFECATIVGRSFQDVGDHADYLRNGGCSKIMDILSVE
ncbi:MAG: C-GCAxxG-C-C family (seleno)protein [Thermodesulfobacteriota bacterium]